MKDSVAKDTTGIQSFIFLLSRVMCNFNSC
jgi:hypothetical protein